MDLEDALGEAQDIFGDVSAFMPAAREQQRKRRTVVGGDEEEGEGEESADEGYGEDADAGERSDYDDEEGATAAAAAGDGDEEGEPRERRRRPKPAKVRSACVSSFILPAVLFVPYLFQMRFVNADSSCSFDCNILLEYCCPCTDCL